jgi:hypothetical protein
MNSAHMGLNTQGTSYQNAGHQESIGSSDPLEVYFECITSYVSSPDPTPRPGLPRRTANPHKEVALLQPLRT